MKTREEWREHVRKGYYHLPPEEHERIVDEIMSTHPDHVPTVASVPEIPVIAPEPETAHESPWLRRIFWAIIALTLVTALAPQAHCQRDSQIYTIGFSGNGVTGTKTYAGPFKITLGSNLSGSVSGSTITLSASSTASTAFSALTASTNSNAGTFSVSGNTWDFTAALLVKMRAAAGLTTSTNGDFGFDTTAGLFHVYAAAGDRIGVVSTNAPTADCVPIGNSDGTTTCGDPLVQGTQAAASTTIPNPVVVGGSDYGGTAAVRVWKVDSSGNGYVSLTNSSIAVTGTFWQTTQPVSAASLPLPTGAATSAKQPALGTAGSASSDVITIQGIASMTPVKVDNSGVTQPISAVSLPLPSGAATAANQTGDPCGPAFAKSYAFYDASTNGATQLVALSSGKVIYVCSYTMTSSSSTANTLKLVYGTGSNCATGQTAITPGFVLQSAASQGPVGITHATPGLATIASNALCVLTNAAVAAQVEVSYVQP